MHEQPPPILPLGGRGAAGTAPSQPPPLGEGLVAAGRKFSAAFPLPFEGRGQGVGSVINGPGRRRDACVPTNPVGRGSPPLVSEGE